MSSDSLQLLNQFLIALPGTDEESVFAKSVSLICQYDNDGAMGIVINRPSELNLGEVMDQLGIELLDLEARKAPVLHGGAVHAERGFVLHDGGMSWDSSLQVGEGIYLTTSREILEAIGRGDGPRNAMVALGCAAWENGQLERELGDNFWLTAPADTNLLFDIPLEMRWDAAAGRLGFEFRQLMDYAGHA